MGFMQKNVNNFVLALVLVVAGALAASSLYYQVTFDSLNDRLDTAKGNLSQCSDSLANTRLTLERIQASLNTTTQDIRRYDELYSSKATELQTTQSTLEETEKQLTEKSVALQSEAAQKEKYRRDYESQAAQNAQLQEQNAILTSQKSQLESSVISYRSQLEQSQDCIDSFIDTYSAGLTQAMKDSAENCK